MEIGTSYKERLSVLTQQRAGCNILTCISLLDTISYIYSQRLPLCQVLSTSSFLLHHEIGPSLSPLLTEGKPHAEVHTAGMQQG